jgi:hypothetical protein
VAAVGIAVTVAVAVVVVVAAVVVVVFAIAVLLPRTLGGEHLSEKTVIPNVPDSIDDQLNRDALGTTRNWYSE